MFGMSEFAKPFDYVFLYRKRGGEYFLYGKGGAATKYSNEVKSNPSTRAAGEKITPLSTRQAMEWAEKFLSVEEYESIFGEVSEDGEMPGKSQISIWVTDGQKKQAQELSLTHAEVYAAGLKALGGK